jgi:DNA processing protein
MWNEDRIAWLTLSWFSGFGSKTLRKLRQRFRDDGTRAVHATRIELLELGVTEYQSDAFLEWRAKTEPDMLARRLDAEHIRFVLPTEEEYPSFLLHASDPPQQLFVRGAPLMLTRPVAVVGTRAITGYGSRVTRQLVADLVKGGCDVISGLALGIDAAAHTSALDAGGHTVAVLAGGINDDAIYPRQNAGLAERILGSGGSIVSEVPPGTESLRHLFPLRNRIIASLSTAVIVVEAAESSGSLLTAKLALDENRDVFAVPGPITSEQSRGTNKLITLGATPYLAAEDVLRLFDPVTNVLQRPPPTLSDDERSLLEILDRPLHIDDIIRALDEPPASVSGRLSILELHGCVEQQGAQIYSRTLLGRDAVATPSLYISD